MDKQHKEYFIKLYRMAQIIAEYEQLPCHVKALQLRIDLLKR